MEFDDIIGRKARGLMQVVDVLGDDGGNFAGTIERRQGAVTTPRFGLVEGVLHGKAPAPCFVAGVLAGHEFIERNRLIAAPQSARRAEVGNAAFGRNPGSGKGHDDGRARDHVAEPFHVSLKLRCNHGQPQRQRPC